MKTERKTWTAVAETETLVERNRLIYKADLVFKNKTSFPTKLIPLCISGIPLELPPRTASQVLISRLTSENEEYLSLCRKYNNLGLKREAIIKTEFFKSIIRRVDLRRDLFTFETFDEDGTVLANLKNLSSSSEFFSCLDALESYLSGLNKLEELNTKNVESLISRAAEQMKDDLWPKRTDNLKTTEMRRIPVLLLKAPDRTKDRLVEWTLKGFYPKITAHRGAITPVISKDYLSSTIQTIRELMSQIDEDSKIWIKLDNLINLIDDKFPTVLFSNSIPGRRNDPILYINDGEWTIIVDQYADFPKEKEIIQTIKNHYNLLGQRYGIIEQKN